MSKELTIYCVRQPDGITCGPSSLFSACVSLIQKDETRPIVTLNNRDTGPIIKELGNIMGTCMAYGTRHIEMQAGLRYVGLPVIEGVPGVPVLEDKIQPQITVKARTAIMDRLISCLADNIILLRTAWYGCKHWVLVVGYENGLFQVMDPAAGCVVTVDTRNLHRFWADRGYDCFVVSRQARLQNQGFLEKIGLLKEERVGHRIMTQEIRTQAQTFFAGLPISEQMAFTSTWRVCQTQVEDHTLEMAPVRKGCKAAREKVPVYRVHHMVAKVRETFWGLMLTGKAPEECKELSLKEWGIA